jgi:nitrogen PTS system EIIA component
VVLDTQVCQIDKLIDAECIAFLSSEKRDEALAELVSLLEKTGKVDNGAFLLSALEKREEVGSTAIGLGVAIPHARLQGASPFLLAIGIRRGKGIPWKALDSAPVKLLFLIVGPAEQPAAFLSLLSKLTFAIADRNRREKLLGAQGKDEVIAQFQGV